MMRLTTILLFVLLLLTVIKANAQVTIRPIRSVITEDELLEYMNRYKTPNAWIQVDTIKSKLLVSVDGLEFDKGSIYTIVGYEVIKVNTHLESLIELLYLDENKKPLNSKINVWMSKPLK